MSKNSSIGLNFLEVLLVVFLILKLTKVIDWSWWWVTFPLWGGIIIGIILIYVVYKKWHCGVPAKIAFWGIKSDNSDDK